MSLLSRDREATDTLLPVAPVLLPRVNLLPPEVGERARFRRVQAGLCAGVVAVAGAVGLMWLSASHSASAARTDLATATTRHAALQRQSAAYADVTRVGAAAAAAQAQLASAMGDEVRYSQLLNDLALAVPSNVWLKSVGFTRTAATAAGASTPTTVPGSSIGTLTVAGTGFGHDDVALWLDSLGGLRTYRDPYVSSSTEALLGKRTTVNFTSTASLLSTALSGRYTRTGG